MMIVAGFSQFIDFSAFLLALAIVYLLIAVVTTYLGYKLHFVVGLLETGFWTFLTGIILVVLL